MSHVNLQIAQYNTASEVIVSVGGVPQSSASVLLELGQSKERSLINLTRSIFCISFKRKYAAVSRVLTKERFRDIPE